MIIVNFSHPLRDDQLTAISAPAGASIVQVVELLESTCQFDQQAPFRAQARALLAGAGISPGDWARPVGELVVTVPPSLSAITCLVMAEMHARLGYFPPIVRLAPRPRAMPVVFDVAEVIDLQGHADEVRGEA